MVSVAIASYQLVKQIKGMMFASKPAKKTPLIQKIESAASIIITRCHVIKDIGN